MLEPGEIVNSPSEVQRQATEGIQAWLFEPSLNRQVSPLRPDAFSPSIVKSFWSSAASIRFICRVAWKIWIFV